MALSIYSTLARQVVPFTPLVAGKVGMYVCGVTVYDYCHIGHARTFVAFDVIRRWLEASGYAVTFVRNVTDVDDKIIRRKRDFHKGTHRHLHARDAGGYGKPRVPCAHL